MCQRNDNLTSTLLHGKPQPWASALVSSRGSAWRAPHGALPGAVLLASLRMLRERPRRRSFFCGATMNFIEACPTCKLDLQIPEKKATERITCPKCGSTFFTDRAVEVFAAQELLKGVRTSDPSVL